MAFLLEQLQIRANLPADELCRSVTNVAPNVPTRRSRQHRRTSAPFLQAIFLLHRRQCPIPTAATSRAGSNLWAPAVRHRSARWAKIFIICLIYTIAIVIKVREWWTFRYQNCLTYSLQKTCQLPGIGLGTGGSPPSPPPFLGCPPPLLLANFWLRVWQELIFFFRAVEDLLSFADWHEYELIILPFEGTQPRLIPFECALAGLYLSLLPGQRIVLRRVIVPRCADAVGGGER